MTGTGPRSDRPHMPGYGIKAAQGLRPGHRRLHRFTHSLDAALIQPLRYSAAWAGTVSGTPARGTSAAQFNQAGNWQWRDGSVRAAEAGPDGRNAFLLKMGLILFGN
ncbi:MAG TPA: hypothetical protein VN767_14220 [Streptosporangiaceae bacterium]|nr:hypothetical protein [Streptosporangiaceae bacterium]